MNETKFWICDKCGEKIESIEDGWVEWLTFKDNEDNFKDKKMRIVHHAKCNYTNQEIKANNASQQGDDELKEFIGADGLMQLLSFISEDTFEDRENLLEIIKRIHIPGYEEARLYFEEAIHNGVFVPNTKDNYYLQNQIQAVLENNKNKAN